MARDWNNPAVNPGLAPFFIPASDKTYQAALLESRSVGYYGLLRYDLTPRWFVFYKLDDLILDSAFQGDAFIRHGLGVEHALNANLLLNVRIERAISGRPEISGNNTLASQGDLIALLRLWL